MESYSEKSKRKREPNYPMHTILGLAVGRLFLIIGSFVPIGFWVLFFTTDCGAGEFYNTRGIILIFIAPIALLFAISFGLCGYFVTKFAAKERGQLRYRIDKNLTRVWGISLALSLIFYLPALDNILLC